MGLKVINPVNYSSPVVNRPRTTGMIWSQTNKRVRWRTPMISQEAKYALNYAGKA